MHNDPTRRAVLQKTGKTGIRRLINAFGYSRDGLKAAYRSEAAFRQVVWLNAVLAALLVVLPFALPIKMLLLCVSGLSLMVELINTAIEAVVDRVSPERHPLCKIAKDAGSAAQLVCVLLQSALWAMAFYSRF